LKCGSYYHKNWDITELSEKLEKTPQAWHNLGDQSDMGVRRDFREQKVSHPRRRKPRALASPVLVGVVAGATLLTGGFSAVASSASATSPAVPAARVGSGPAMPQGSRTAGALPASTRLQATVTLEPASQTALEQYATDVSTPGNALYQHFLTNAEFSAQFAPSTSTVAEVEGVLQRDGLSPSAVSADHLAIKVSGSAAQFSRAFDTGFVRYQLPSGRVAYANTVAPLIPGSIVNAVQGVIGLDNIALAHPQTATVAPGSAGAAASPQVVTGGPQPCAAAKTAGPSNDALTADQLASAYSFSSLYHAADFGAGKTIAMYELQTNLPSDIAAYQTCYGTNAAVKYVKVDGGSGRVAAGVEATLDIQVAIGLAPKASILVYQGPNTSNGAYDTYNSIISQDKVQVLSTSWGTCEPQQGRSAALAENTLFQESATKGISVVDAAGDLGSEDCGTNALAIDDPGDQPFVTVVGGTKLTKLGPPPTEIVWNERANGAGAGGGGISTFFDMPTYQSGAPASLHVINAHSSGTLCGAAKGSYCREEPDVTADADPYTGYVVYVGGSWTGVGGTSAAAPLFASLLTLTNASTSCAGTAIGFANPALYTIAGSSSYKADFYDITSGNNDYTGTNHSLYPAGPGYDMASGLGAPNGANLPKALCAEG
jgi:subtilase family serine protease